MFRRQIYHHLGVGIKSLCDAQFEMKIDQNIRYGGLRNELWFKDIGTARITIVSYCSMGLRKRRWIK